MAMAAAGYGDGYPRNAASGTPVQINGRRAPLAGRVSMDMMAIDVTDLPPSRSAIPCVLWGSGFRWRRWLRTPAPSPTTCSAA